MSLFDIYKARKLGIGADSLFNTLLANIEGAEYETVSESFPYSVRKTADGADVAPKCSDTIVGGSVVWNQLVGTEDTSVTVPSGHVYFANIGGTKTIEVSDGSALTVVGATDNVIDLTLLFGSAIANYIKTLETSHAGDGVAYFTKLFPEDYYSPSNMVIQSVNTSARITKSANGNVLGNYALDESLVLNGMPVLDANNKLYYDGDTYESDGLVTRKFAKKVFQGNESVIKIATSAPGWNMFAVTPSPSAINTDILIDFISDAALSAFYADVMQATEFSEPLVVHYGVGFRFVLNLDDVSSAKAWLKGKTLIYKLATSTTESADSFTDPQTVRKGGTEEYVDYSVEQGDRDVSIPVGHITEYKVRSDQ